MECLIVGYGSIGKRHAEILSQLNCAVSLVTSQSILEYSCFTALEAAFDKKTYELIIIANPTHLHYHTLKQLILRNYSGIILVEKPLFAQAEHLAYSPSATIFVAYNLRFSMLL